jgi:aminoglycoside 3-N-acetyltransferase
MLTKYNIKEILEKNGYSNSVICLHSSFKSFGLTEDGPNTIIDGFILANNTILAPAFYYGSETSPGFGNYKRNGIDYSQQTYSPVNYQGLDEQIDKSMGIIPKMIIKYNGAIRSKHPCNSFVALGEKARELMAVQDNLNVYSAYKKIMSGKTTSYIFLAGTGLKTCTPIHFAEEKAGRQLFRRWALHENKVEEVEVGGCSAGFENLSEHVENIGNKITIGSSVTSVFVFKEFIERVADVLRKNPGITKCGDNHCLRCRDSVAGGPLFDTRV